jgi:hypothetical protein
MFGSSISTRGNLQRKDLCSVQDFDSTGSSFDLSFQSDQYGQQPTMKDTLLVSLRSEELCLMSLTLIIKWCVSQRQQQRQIMQLENDLREARDLISRRQITSTSSANRGWSKEEHELFLGAIEL